MFLFYQVIKMNEVTVDIDFESSLKEWAELVSTSYDNPNIDYNHMGSIGVYLIDTLVGYVDYSHPDMTREAVVHWFCSARKDYVDMLKQNNVACTIRINEEAAVVQLIELTTGMTISSRVKTSERVIQFEGITKTYSPVPMTVH